MKLRIHLMTLGVKDVKRSRRFYEKGLGFEASSASQGDIVFFHAGGVVLALYPLKALAKDATVAEHSHHNEQITMVEKGALKFAIDGGHKVVHGGETLVIPPNVPHSVIALEDTVVFDVFAPSRG